MCILKCFIVLNRAPRSDAPRVVLPVSQRRRMTDPEPVTAAVPCLLGGRQQSDNNPPLFVRVREKRPNRIRSKYVHTLKQRYHVVKKMTIGLSSVGEKSNLAEEEL